MDELKFVGRIVKGIGQHVDLAIPGRSELQGALEDWPEKLTPGSLNLRVSKFPDEFVSRQLEPSTKSLDVAGFAPALIIPQYALGNNKLEPTSAMPNRGTAQVWRAVLDVNNEKMPCWVLRRFGSGLRDQIEIVADVHLRTTLGLSIDREWPASVTMLGVWSSQ